MRSRRCVRKVLPILSVLLLSLAALALTPVPSDLLAARDRGDREALGRFIQQASDAAKTNSKSGDAQYRLAVAYFYGSEVAYEQHDKAKSEQLAESGLEAAKLAVAVNDKNAEFHRILGALCGQVIPANPLMGTLKYGPCARDEINRAIELDSRNALAYVSRGVGNYYLPASMGGGPEIAIKDFDKAISLDPKSPEAYLWKGITLRKEKRNHEAHVALEQAVQLSPNRLWAKEQLQKTPAN